MSHKVLKPFHSPEYGRILQAGESFSHGDECRVRDLEEGGLIEPSEAREEKAHKAAPSNKDAAGKRSTK